MNQTWAVILGAVIALVTSIVVEYVRLRLADSRTKRLLKALLKIEIPTICATADSLVETFNRVGFLDALIIGQLQSARQGYDRNRDWVILFPEESFQVELIEFYQRLLRAQQDAIGIETFAGNPAAQAAYITPRRTAISNDFRDIATRGRALLPRLNDQ